MSRYSYRPSRYEDLTVIRKPDGGVEVIIGKDHAATGYNSESVSLPVAEAAKLAELFAATPDNRQEQP